MTIDYDKDGVAIYTPPARFAHLDYPTAAKFNKISAGVLASYEKLFQTTHQMAAYQGPVSIWSVFHRFDYLIYRTPNVEGMQPRISPLNSEIGDEISLPESRDRYSTFDLRTVEWLSPGMIYTLTDVAGAMEDLTELLYA
jgi:hypothetical protein